MAVSTQLKAKPSKRDFRCLLDLESNQIATCSITSAGLKALKEKPASWQKMIRLSESGLEFSSIQKPEKLKNHKEHYRLAGADMYNYLKDSNLDSVFISGGTEIQQISLAQGLILSAYSFHPYKKESKEFHLKSISLDKGQVSADALKELNALMRAVYFSRDLVNEPANVLTAVEMSKRISQLSEDSPLKVEVLKKAKIKSLKMGGLLAVNQGSTKEPTFNILEYKPKSATNSKPVVLVGKGIVYDTGGLSLKPTPNSMDIMKCDMGGAAAVAGAIYALALADIPIHVLGLIPATDNQPGPDAYQPGDVIEMMNGLNVEVMNTDAEGRMVMADALSYAAKYKPMLAIDVATLTGSAVRALGPYAAATMGTADTKIMQKLLNAGMHSWERLVEFPVWDDYETELSSDIADTKNLGGAPYGDVMIAGMFLKKFTSYPWIHIDIAGPAFLSSPRGYLPKGGTGFGTALLFEFLKELAHD